MDPPHFAAIAERLRDAGYYRAGLAVLSPFDRIIGGIVWCLAACRAEVRELDIDRDVVRFRENLSIGERM